MFRGRPRRRAEAGLGDLTIVGLELANPQGPGVVRKVIVPPESPTYIVMDRTICLQLLMHWIVLGLVSWRGPGAGSSSAAKMAMMAITNQQLDQCKRRLVLRTIHLAFLVPAACGGRHPAPWRGSADLVFRKIGFNSFYWSLSAPEIAPFGLATDRGYNGRPHVRARGDGAQVYGTSITRLKPLGAR